MQIPYSKIELQIALLGVNTKIEKYEQTHGEGSLEKTLENRAPTYEDTKEACAKFHGIDVATLINSPNYLTLKEEHLMDALNKGIAVLKSEFDFTDKEAWAAVCAAKGLLD